MFLSRSTEKQAGLMQRDKNDMKVEQSVSMHSHALEQPCKRQIVTDPKSRNASQLTKTSFLKSVFKCTECSHLVAKSCFVYF